MAGPEFTEWVLSLDPVEVATGRTELSLNSLGNSIRIDQTGIDWGDAAITAFMAAEKWGSVPVEYVVPNRIVTIPLGVGMTDAGQTAFDTARSQLHQKVALLQREGGWLKRERTGQKMYADVVNATLHEPDMIGPTGAVEDGLVLTLECLPDFYGDEVTLDAITGTGRALGLVKAAGVQAAIAGDYPARCRLIVTDTSGNNQDGVLWGFRSRRYDAASTAALFYEAEAMTSVNGSASALRSGASGGSTMKITSLPGSTWLAMLLTDVGGAQLTHQGSYRVWARVFATDAGTQVRLAWGSGSLASPIINAAVTVPSTGGFYLVDLGTVRLDATPVAAGSWQGVVQVNDPITSGTFEVDSLLFQPIDESSGRLATSPSQLTNANGVQTADLFTDDSSIGTVVWDTSGISWKATLGASAISHYAKVTTLTFAPAIPALATIVGLKLVFNRRATSGAVTDLHVRMLKAGVAVGTDKAVGVAWPGAYAQYTYGGPADLWGTTWTAAQVNSANFGYEIAVAAGAGGAVAEINLNQLTVYYTLAGGFVVAQDVVVAANGQCEVRTEGAYRPDPSAGAWGAVSTVIGDLPRLPPSGLEGRAVELLARVSRGDLGSDATTSQDGALDALTAQVKYRPCWLHRP